MTAWLLCKSLRKRKRWCGSVVKSLYSHHALKPLIPALCLVAVLIYSQADRLRNFVAGVFIPQYHYPYAAALCFAQVVISLLVINLFHLLDLVPVKPYSQVLGERLLVPAICDSIRGVVDMWAKASSSYAGLFPLTVRLLPLVTVGWSLFLRLAVPPSVHVSVVVSIMTGISIVITASHDSASIEPLEYLYAPLSLFLHSLSLTWLAKVYESERRRRRTPDAQASIFDIYYTQLVNQAWVLGLLCLLHPDSPAKVLSQGSWNSLLFNAFLLAILLLGTVLNFLVGSSALCFSPLAAALLHSARELLLPFIQLL
ncbi:uncharacterized protein LOC142988156 [Genypterus blacodes]|uniref:uncharacterized protein LOC142988156 n=1 Tax=Genypterus blacodes TaxID=154954 RepID=UPI003F772A94